jgi:hypothetical protein
MSDIKQFLKSHPSQYSLAKDIDGLTFSHLLTSSARILMASYRSCLPLYLFLVLISLVCVFFMPTIGTVLPTSLHIDFISFVYSVLYLVGIYLLLAFFTQTYISLQVVHAGALQHALVAYCKKFIHLLLASFLVSLMIVCASILVIPGIYLMVTFILFIPPLIINDESAFQAIKSSYKLLSGQWWLGLLTVGMPVVVYALCIGVLSKFTFMALNTSWLSIVLYPAILVFFICFYLNLYLNLYQMKQASE